MGRFTLLPELAYLCLILMSYMLNNGENERNYTYYDKRYR